MNYPFKISSGYPLPLGVTAMAKGFNFALFSRHGKKVSLVLELVSSGNVEKTGQRFEIELDRRTNKTGDIWHIIVLDPTISFKYGYRISGLYTPDTDGHCFDDKLILIDPYAKALRNFNWGEEKSGLGKEPCCLPDNETYDWEDDRPPEILLKDTIIYELHVRGFTIHPSSYAKHGGTFYGIAEKIDYLKQLGITAVELMPVTEFNENELIFCNPITGKELTNFWGYSPLSFFAPKSAYCREGISPLTEFRDMVKALHKAGIEVLLDIVFNHTAEGGKNGPTTSFRGIDNSIYYLLDPWTKAYLNFSGCGNTFNCNHPIVRTLIMDALRWWVIEMHVDGFRFDLASVLGRDQNGNVLSNPPVVEQIAEDPILADVKIIAEAWDAAGLYQVGSFSTHYRWAEWNGRFRDDVRSFMCGEKGKVPALATRIAGSSDLYQHSEKRPCNSINFITSHDGFTLLDLVSFDKKHNIENGENNRDGENNNLSWNSGIEGKTKKQNILRLRFKRIRTMAVILFISQGVPMLVAGDEFGRSQNGNNNAYCQDNEISWVDWNLIKQNKGLLYFFKKLIKLRRDHPIFRRDTFFSHHSHEHDPIYKHEIIWQGPVSNTNIWANDSNALAFTLNGSAANDFEDDDFFVMLNGNKKKKETFIIPSPPTLHSGRCWKKIIDTSLVPPNDFMDLKTAVSIAIGSKLSVKPMGCIILQSCG